MCMHLQYYMYFTKGSNRRIKTHTNTYTIGLFVLFKVYLM